MESERRENPVEGGGGVPPAGARDGHLRRLRDAVVRRAGRAVEAGVLAATAERPPVLRVVRPMGGRPGNDPREDVGCDFQDGGWWFVWRWGLGEGQVIAPAERVEVAAGKIVAVLGLPLPEDRI